MKKTTTISIAQQLFHIEEDAFVLLDEYLRKINHYFAAEPDAQDIISDIEFRIAEHFSSQEGVVITKNIVEQVIDTMGTVEQFTDDSTQKSGKLEKKLYRDQDGKIIAGVASGLAYYFGVSNFLIRLLFAISIFFGGFGVALYIILWIVIPEAKTSTQKLEMRGQAATLKTMTDFVRNEYAKVEATVEQNTHRFLVRIIYFLRKVAGLVAVIGSFVFAIIWSVLAALALMKGFADTLGLDTTLLTITNSLYFTAMVVFGFFVVMLPTVIVFLWGVDILWAKHTLKKISSLTFLSIWFMSIVIAGVCGAQVLSQYLKIEKEVYRQRAVPQRVDIVELKID